MRRFKMHGFLLLVCLSLMCTTMAYAENAEEVANCPCLYGGVE